MSGLIGDAVTGLAAPLFGLVDELFTSDEERAEAKRKLLTAEGRQALERARVQMSAILAEAQSKDPWTSRARPAFFYVMYVYLLAGIPIGVISAFVDPNIAIAIGHGMREFLHAIPDMLYGVFGTGFLGYGAMRTWEKTKGVAK